MNRIFKISSLVVVALTAMCGCTDDLSLSPTPVTGGSHSVPFGTIRFQAGEGTRAKGLTTENLSAVEATAYTDIEKNEFKFEKFLFNKENGENGAFICDKNPQWPGIHRYRKPDADGKYSEDTPEAQKIPAKYSDWKDRPFDEKADTKYADYHEPKEGVEVKEEEVPTGYVYLEHYKDPDWIYIIDYDEPSTLNLFVYSPPLKQLRAAFNSGTQGKPGSQGIMLKAPEGVYDFYNTYVDGVGLTPPVNYNEHTELKIYYDDGVGKPGYKLGMFHVAQDISQQVDFVTANMTPKARKINKTEEEGETVYKLEPVPVNLEHKLCNIEIKAMNDNPNYDVDVAGVMIGRPMVYGPMFNFTTDEWEFPPLTRQDLYDVVTYGYSPADANNTVGDYIHRLGPEPVSLMGNGGNALVLPTKLSAWDYKDPDNPDAYSFNNGDRPIMFLAALIQVTSKGEDASPVDMVYPCGSMPKEYDGNDKNNCWVYDNSDNVWLSSADNCSYYEDYEAWWYYGEDIAYDEDYNLVTWDDNCGRPTGFSLDYSSGLWTYDETKDSGNYYANYAWLLNWRIDEDEWWHYIGKDWELVKDEDGNPLVRLIDEDYYYCWKYTGKVNFEYDEIADAGQWTIGTPKKLIFPTDYVCKKGNFDIQEFCVVQNGFTHEFDNPGLGADFKPDYVLDNSKYNDRDKGLFTDQEKKDFIRDIKRQIEAHKETGYHPNEDTDLVIQRSKDVKFRKYAWVGFPVSVDWKQGKKYKYTLDFTNGLGIETPNGIYGGRLISDIIKLFEEEANGGSEDDENNPESPTKSASLTRSGNQSTSAEPGRKVKATALPEGWGTVEEESSVWEPGDIIVKKK